MKRIEPRQKARSPTSLIPLILIIVAAVALSISGVAVAKKCDNPPCGGGGGGGDAPAEFTAALVSGGFTFDAVDVSLNRKGNTYSSTVGLSMIRPDDSNEAMQWDDVFAVCPELFFSDEVPSVWAPNNWTIDNSGGKNAGKVGSNIRVSFRDVSVPDYPEVVLDFGLIGVLEEELPPTSGTISVVLTKFNFFGAGNPPAGCSSGTLDLYKEYSVLEITRK